VPVGGGAGRPALDDGSTGDDTTGMTSVTRGGIVLGVTGAVVAAVVVVALVLAVQAPNEFDPGTPEAAVSGYFQALIDRNRAEAERFMAPDLVDHCGSDLDQVREAPDGLRVVIVATERDGDRMLVTVRITERSGPGPLLGDEHTFEETLVLAEVAGDWLIAEVPWPIYCREV
jgi:hypothetical protein